MSTFLDAAGLRSWAQNAVDLLSDRRAEINALNVFPVPDADTGSNMAHTMRAAVEHIPDDATADPISVASALASGAVRGARGNSGMVLSQILRGITDTVTDTGLDGAALARALSTSVDYVTTALADPVEGTIITVLRAAARAAEDAGSHNASDLTETATAAIEGAAAALEKTTGQLPALSEAGVIDAGGAGLVLVLTALRDTAGGEETTTAGSDSHSSPEPEPNASTNNAAGSGTGSATGTGNANAAACEIEVIFYYSGDLPDIERALRPLGNSLVIARTDDSRASVHIHTAAAGRVIETAFARGTVSNLRVEALPPSTGRIAPGEEDTPLRTVFAAAPAGPVADLFASAGARVVAPGEPAAGAGSDDIVLRNGTRTSAGDAVVIDTGSLVAGIAAMSVYDDALEDTREAAATMRDAAAAMRVDHPRENTLGAIMSTCRDLLFGGGEQITILSPTVIDAEAMSAQLGVDVMALQVPDMHTEIGVE